MIDEIIHISEVCVTNEPVSFTIEPRLLDGKLDSYFNNKSRYIQSLHVCKRKLSKGDNAARFK